MRNMATHHFSQMIQMIAILLTWLLFIWIELREKRKRQGLSIKGAAEICGVDTSTYARWERGKQKPHPRNYRVLMEKIDPYDEVWFSEMNYVPDAFLPPSYWND
jgi:DNA-binding XRE family transcriptional regulator